MRNDIIAHIPGRKTAMKRSKPPLPLRWLYLKKMIKGPALDYGCGRQTFYRMAGYDPAYRPCEDHLHQGSFRTIVCCYVFNVINAFDRGMTLVKMLDLLQPGGKLYIAVRRDLPREGQPGRGCYQYFVELPAPAVLIREVGGYAIYEFTKETCHA